MAQQLKIDIVARDKSKQAMGRLQGSLSKVKASVFSLKSAFIGLGAGLVIKSIISAGIQIENLGVQLTALFGSAKKGKEALDQVKKFAETTPFELSNIQQGVTALATVAETAEKAGISFDELLKITGNTAVILGGDFAIASQQIQRAFSAGIGSADLFRDKAVTAMAGFSAGVKVNVDQSIKGLSNAFGTGGEFGRLIEELAKTLSGTISNLKDTLFKFQESIASGFFYELKQELGDLKKFTEENDEAIRAFGVSMGENLAIAIVKTSDAIKILTDNFRKLLDVVGLLMVAFGGWISIIVGTGVVLNNLAHRTKEYFKDVNEGIKRINESDMSIPIVVAIEAVKNLNKELEYTAQTILDIGHDLSEEVPNSIKKITQDLTYLNNSSLAEIKEKFKNVHTIIAENIDSGITKMSEGLGRALVFGENLKHTLQLMAQNVLAKIVSILIEQIIREQILSKLNNTRLNQLWTQLSIEKLITAEKKAQASASKSSGGGDLQTAFQIASLFSGGGFASGGAVSKGQPILVGERGAELFVPNQTGQITQSARGTGGGGATVNFNINTLDASGFDDLLVRNRGTITQIINSAVNERGNGNLI
jgi:hypothetical protein